MTNALFDYITSSALSLTMAGNTGISPFLTLLILGVVEMGNPELLNMGETMEVLLTSWWSIGILGLLTIAEIVGKCIPAIDEMIDSAEVFVVPVISILASMATLGLLGGGGGGSQQSDVDAGQGQSVDVLGLFGGGDGDGYGDGYGYRSLQETAEIENIDDIVVVVVEDDSDNDFGEGFITFTKICLVVVGIGLSLLIHFFKMSIRVSSLVCSAGCCQPCITIMEFVLVVCGVLFAILAPVFAVVACIALLVAAGYVIRVKFCKKKNDDNEDNKQNNNNNNNNNNGVVEKKGTRNSKNDEENPERTRAKRNSSTTPPTNDITKWAHNTSTAPSEALSVDEFVTVPLSPPVAPKPDVEATSY